MKRMTTINELKKLIMKSKRTDKEKSAAYAAILKQVESKTIGVKNPETDEEKLILSAAKSELKEQMQSKKSGAPYSEVVVVVCEAVIEELSGDMLSEDDTNKAIDEIIASGETHRGKIMGALKAKFGDSIDMAMANKLVGAKL